MIDTAFIGMDRMETDDSGFVSTLSHLIECGVCKKPAKQQKVLECQHSMCVPCVKKLKIAKRRFKCSVCSKVSY